MGSKYAVSQADMLLWRSKIYDLAFSCSCLKDKYQYYLLIVWIYEYIEVSAVNNTNEHAGLVPVKKAHPEHSDVLFNLFKVRGQLVHSPYNIDRVRLEHLDADKDKINEVLYGLGFQRPVLTFDNCKFID